MSDHASKHRARGIAVHGCRLALLAMVLLLIHFKYRQHLAAQPTAAATDLDLAVVGELFPAAAAVNEPAGDGDGRAVLDANDNVLGRVIQTSPTADHIVGFSGPTNMLIALDADGRIAGFAILSSRDTRDHVRQIEPVNTFLAPLIGLAPSQAVAAVGNVDAVSGATLTSMAIQEGIALRLGGERRSLRFPEPLTVEDARPLFPDVAAVRQDQRHASLWEVRDAQDVRQGTLLRTAPAADNIVGYQGPTETLIGLDPQGLIVGIRLRKSYDNEPYVGYVAEDEWYFLTLFNDMTLEELARLDLAEAEIEGVSGATMTSMAVAHGLIAAAEARQQAAHAEPPPAKPWLAWTARDYGTGAVIALGLLIGMTSLRANKWLRVGFQLLLIGYLGLMNGDMLSQAMLVGWAQAGVPWRTAGGLLLLTVAALIVPVATRRNIYCSHLCPHGAVQQLVKKRLPWQLTLPPKLAAVLHAIPTLLLAWCILVAMLLLPFSLVDIEPFDAWVFYVAGWATITVAVVGLGASLFVPMAYCRYGCPTGALLNWLRFNARSDQWTRRDWVALGLALLAAGLWLV
ncbi:MAG: FMN-binding protein [Pirellulales bacterium]